MHHNNVIKIAHSKLTSQGQISVPAVIRKKLGLASGSTIEWDEDEENGQITVKKVGTYSFEDIHKAVFKTKPERKSLEELKEGIGDYMRERYGSVDTNILVRLIVRDDDKQVAQAEAFIKNGASVSHIVIADALWKLAVDYNRTASDQIEILEMLLKHETLSVEDPDTVAAALELFRSTPKLGFMDCLILEISKKAGHLPLGTFDRRLSKISGTERL